MNYVRLAKNESITRMSESDKYKVEFRQNGDNGFSTVILYKKNRKNLTYMKSYSSLDYWNVSRLFSIFENVYILQN